jgi:hypothetical protein
MGADGAGAAGRRAGDHGEGGWVGAGCEQADRAGSPAGMHVVIVDDLVQTGGTLIECAKVAWRVQAWHSWM